MTTMRRWSPRAALGLLAAAVVGVLLTAPTHMGAADKSFTLPSLDTTADVRADGSMEVTEVVTYAFSGGPFNFGIRTFEQDLGSVTDFAAADAQGPLTVIDPSTSVSHQWEWQLRRPMTDETATYTVTYRVRNAVQLGSDVGELNWQFMGTEHPRIDRMSVVVRLPATVPAALPTTSDDDTTVLRAFAHGPRDGLVQVRPSGVIATVDGVPAGQFVELHVVIPISSFTSIGSTPLLAHVLAVERALIASESNQSSAATDAKHRHDLAFSMLPLMSGIAFVGTTATWLVAGREKKSTEVLGKYWREPLDDPPAIALTNLHRGDVPIGPAFAGTLVDLAQRGYLRIVGVKEDGLIRSKTVHHYIWLGKEPGPDVRHYEQLVLDFVFRGQAQTSSEELRDWAKHHQTGAKAKLDAIEGAVKRDYRALDYEDRGSNVARGVLALVCVGVVIASWALKVYTHNGVMFIGVGLAVFLLVLGLRLLMNRSRAGVDAAAKAEGLKKFLHDFSRLEDAPIGHLILWERYLVYAVALGVSAELLRGIEGRLPALAADPQFSTWYVGPVGGHGRFDGFGDIESFGPSIVSASTPNSSGSGGGFSGGGSSGGGGGGGFGAR